MRGLAQDPSAGELQAKAARRLGVDGVAAPAGRELTVKLVELVAVLPDRLRFANGREVSMGQVEALSAAVIQGEPDRILLDLHLDGPPSLPKEILRLDNQTMNPRALLGRPELPPMDAFRGLIHRVHSGGGARILALQGQPSEEPGLTLFGDLATYEAQLRDR